jgi:hypothetical protein
VTAVGLGLKNIAPHHDIRAGLNPPSPRLSEVIQDHDEGQNGFLQVIGTNVLDEVHGGTKKNGER